MKKMIKIIKGICVGMGGILPGLSGSMVATILNIYHELILAINHFTKHPIRSILSIWQYLIGIIIGFGIGFVFIKFGLTTVPLIFTMLFVGLIVGAIPFIIKSMINEKPKWHYLLVFIIMMTVMILFLLIRDHSNGNTGNGYYISVFLIGFVYAIALIIPGLSGSTLLIALGFFQTFLLIGNDTIEAILSLEFSGMIAQAPTILILILGIVVGLILMGKAMYQILKKYQTHFQYGVLGIIIISPINIMVSVNQETTDSVFRTSWWMWVISIFVLILGFYLSYRLTIKSEFKQEIKE
jgi:putative membrane protein